ncbi:glycosyltransferase family 4 protein [Bacteroides salyersiae]|jgi:glycosyltransferase|uniref:Glycosyltransferase subfamily 4-like N-terminal domain-containing protein n=2 Tax=Bacteroides salyersiae TaxID=291644 RepID=I8Y0H1_9BACE|nr:glycosyltransferase family 4 protein [Bacteroides salyersiae]EIY55787.1 hypothetical protein HMPREF1071_04486 [Bacteroides salyersiae CL02T12C01]KAB5345135.1 glycosyltransferase family 4 protein [Bacteroides salyersiae]KAB5354353.1 glycosyltransferase family 4 protein [Bacteroides salyersiae]KAB5360508.1 glycosyltransferase family 4 protein [Bacteroides salyersiae]KAB5367082.1 glycosyltransferase family 4 protein [Bacteroides salyersiae]
MGNNILVLANSIIGLHSFRKEVVKAMVDNGYVVYLAFPDKDERAKYFEQIDCKYVDVKFDRRGMNPIKDLKLLLDYIKVIKRIKPVAVLTYTIKPNVYGGIAAAYCGVPLLANVTGLGDAVENKGFLGKLTVFLYKLGLRKANTVFFQNNSNLKFCVDSGIVVQEQSCLLPGSGVNTSYHVYQEYPTDNIIKFLFIARLLKDKGTEEYFETAKIIKEKYPNTEFQILGYCDDGKYQTQLDELTKAGVINFLGCATDVRPYIGDVYCTIMPSYHEGLSNVNLESEANGRPVITTKVPGCKETVDDGITGYLCDVRSTQDLTDKVEKFINLPYEEKKQMGLNARRKVEREFERQIIVDAYLKAIKILQ